MQGAAHLAAVAPACLATHSPTCLPAVTFAAVWRACGWPMAARQGETGRLTAAVLLCVCCSAAAAVLSIFKPLLLLPQAWLVRA